MQKLFNSKKADNSNAVQLLFVIIFLAFIGYITALLQTDLNQSVTSFNLGVFTATGSGYTILNTISSILFWSFNVPIWVNLLVLYPIRIYGAILVYRLILPTTG